MGESVKDNGLPKNSAYCTEAPAGTLIVYVPVKVSGVTALDWIIPYEATHHALFSAVPWYADVSKGDGPEAWEQRGLCVSVERLPHGYLLKWKKETE